VNDADRTEQAAPGARPGTTLLVAIGACVLMLVLGVRWVRERQVERASLPAFEGSLVLPPLEDVVHVRRDNAGVPHIAAHSERDAWLALGFVHAQDRLAQMLWLRQVARGRVAEWLGEPGVLSDRFARSVDFAGHADLTLGSLPEPTRAVLDRYAQGVELRIARIRNGEAGLPAELARLSLELEAIEPWTASDSVAVFKLLCWGAGASIEAASVLDRLTQRLGGVGARPFEPQGEGLQTITVPFPSPGPAETPTGEPPPRADAFVPTLFGGTAWVLAGRHTASGLPVLAADWQLAPTAPSLLHQSHVRSPTLEWAGAFVPGVPIAWLGRNAELAWGLLPARAVTTGFFEETLRAREPAPLYHDGRTWRPVAQRVETIRVLDDGELREEEWLVDSTRHGPLIDPLFHREHAPLSLAWTGARRGDGLSSLIGIPSAESAAALRERLRSHHEPVVAAVFADAGGAGGLQVAGWLPRRVLPTSLQPVPGRLRTYDWGSGIPFDELPHAALVAPEAVRPGLAEPDWLAVADAGWDDAEIETPADAEWLWRSGRRAARLERLLGQYVARGRVDLRDVIEIQRDAVSADGTSFVRAVVAIVGEPEDLAPEEREMLEILRGWDGDLRPSSRAGAVHAVMLEELSAALFSERMGEALFERYRSLPQARLGNITRGVLQAAASSPGAAGWADPERVRPLLREALRRTWARLAHELGPNRERWTWGRLQNARFLPFAPLGGEGAELPGPLGGGESAMSMAAHDARFDVVRATTYRMAVDLAVPDEMLATLAPGQLEHAQHPHFADAVGVWRTGQPTVLRTAPGLIDAAQERVLALEPSR
jgi:penicillin amidase